MLKIQILVSLSCWPRLAASQEPFNTDFPHVASVTALSKDNAQEAMAYTSLER